MAEMNYTGDRPPRRPFPNLTRAKPSASEDSYLKSYFMVRRKKPSRQPLRFEENTTLPALPQTSPQPGRNQRGRFRQHTRRKLKSQPPTDGGKVGARLANAPSMPSLVAKDSFRRATVVYEKLAFSKPVMNGDNLAPYLQPTYKKLKPLPAIERNAIRGTQKVIRRMQNPHENLKPHRRKSSLFYDDDDGFPRGRLTESSRVDSGSDLSSLHGFRPMWKDECDCMRCSIMKQNWTDNDADSYKNWGEYPCVKLPEIDPTQPLSDDED